MDDKEIQRIRECELGLKIEQLQAEVKRLRDLVASSYEEGYCDAVTGFTKDWEKSDTKTALEGE